MESSREKDEWGKDGQWRMRLPRSVVWLKQNRGVNCGCSGVRDMVSGGGDEG